MAPSMLAAVSALGAAFLIHEAGDTDRSDHRPFNLWFGTDLGTGADSLGTLMALAWFGAVITSDHRTASS